MSMWMSDARICTTCPTQITPLTHTLSSILSLGWSFVRSVYSGGFLIADLFIAPVSYFPFSVSWWFLGSCLSLSPSHSVYSHLPRVVRCLFTINH